MYTQKDWDKAAKAWQAGKRVVDIVTESGEKREKVGREILKRVGGRDGWNTLRKAGVAGFGTKAEKAAEKKAEKAATKTKKAATKTKKAARKNKAEAAEAAVIEEVEDTTAADEIAAKAAELAAAVDAKQE